MRVRRSFPTAGAALVIAVALGLSSGCGDLSRGELSRGVESLSALAAQGALVADGVRRDATKATYARAMARTLGGEAEHEAEKLADATPAPEGERERDAAVRAAADLADLFSELQIFPADERRGARVQHQMHEAEEEINGIVVRLTGEEP
jgi:hypothetical protein